MRFLFTRIFLHFVILLTFSNLVTWIILEGEYPVLHHIVNFITFGYHVILSLTAALLVNQQRTLLILLCVLVFLGAAHQDLSILISIFIQLLCGFGVGALILLVLGEAATQPPY